MIKFEHFNYLFKAIISNRTLASFYKMAGELIQFIQIYKSSLLDLFEFTRTRTKRYINFWIPEGVNLLLTNKLIYNELIGQYVKRVYTDMSFSFVQFLRPQMRIWISDLTLTKKNLNEYSAIDISKEIPHIQTLRLVGCDHEIFELFDFVMTYYNNENCPKKLITRRITFCRCTDKKKRPFNILPQKLKKLQMDHNLLVNFESTHSLEKLVLCGEFNQSIGPNVLPQSLTKLLLDGTFNQSIDPNVLPHSLTKLSFGWYFNQPICPGVLPDNIIFCILAMIIINHLMKECCLNI